MNWDALHFDWNQVRALLATVETGTLSAAARALGVAQPTVGRQIAALEESLGVVLFERSGRDLVLTPAGRALIEPLRAMGESAQQLALVAAGQVAGIGGTVVISSSDSVAAYVLPGIMAELADRAPEIERGIVVTNQLSDLMRREADIAIRHLRPTEPELIGKRVGTGQACLYAAPSFLRRYGRPEMVDDLAGLPFVGFAAPERMQPMLSARGLPVRVEDIRFHSENTVAGWELVRRGLGIGLMIDLVAWQTPGVERIVPDFPTVPVELWLVTHRELHQSPRIRLVWDHLASALAR